MAMKRENQLVVTDEPVKFEREPVQVQDLWSGRTGGWLQMNRLSLRNNYTKIYV